MPSCTFYVLQGQKDTPLPSSLRSRHACSTQFAHVHLLVLDYHGSTPWQHWMMLQPQNFLSLTHVRVATRTKLTERIIIAPIPTWNCSGHHQKEQLVVQHLSRHLTDGVQN